MLLDEVVLEQQGLASFGTMIRLEVGDLAHQRRALRRVPASGPK